VKWIVLAEMHSLVDTLGVYAGHSFQMPKVGMKYNNYVCANSLTALVFNNLINLL